jgi:cytochrome c oxidase subunit IV
MLTIQKIRPCTLIYLLLIGLSVATFMVGELGPGSLETSLLVLAIALIKGELVGGWFMGLRGIKGLWRWPVLIWLLIPGLIITLTFIYA